MDQPKMRMIIKSGVSVAVYFARENQSAKSVMRKTRPQCQCSCSMAMVVCSL